MFTIRMNEAAASALQPLAPADQPSAVPVVGQGLRDKLAQGLTYNEGALTFADHVGQWAAQPSVSAAIAEMGWQDLTGYEGNVNAFHLEDYAPVHVAILDGGRPQIRYEDQVMLLRLGLSNRQDLWIKIFRRLSTGPRWPVIPRAARRAC
ncbi:hypothetical protein, partial [Microtetraspora malaysiensis]